MPLYDVYVNKKPDGEMSFTVKEMEYLRKSGYAKKKGVTFRKKAHKTQHTTQFRSKTTFRNWLKRNNYTKDSSPLTGVHNKSGKRIGSAFEKTYQTGANKGKRYIEVDFY